MNDEVHKVVIRIDAVQDELQSIRASASNMQKPAGLIEQQNLTRARSKLEEARKALSEATYLFGLLD